MEDDLLYIYMCVYVLCVCVRDAWSRLGEMSSENAMAAYVDEMKKVAQEVHDFKFSTLCASTDVQVRFLVVSLLSDQIHSNSVNVKELNELRSLI